MKLFANFKCVRCNQQFKSDMKDAMWVWGFDLKKYPLELIHKGVCDYDKKNWSASADFSETWKCLNRKCWSKKRFPIRYIENKREES